MAEIVHLYQIVDLAIKHVETMDKPHEWQRLSEEQMLACGRRPKPGRNYSALKQMILARQDLAHWMEHGTTLRKRDMLEAHRMLCVKLI